MHGDAHWLNYLTGKVVEVEEHEKDVRDWQTASSLGVPRAVFDQFHKFTVGVDRCRFLVWLMKQVPLIRHRNHNPLFATYEFWSASTKVPYSVIARHARQYPDTKLLNIANLRTRRSRQIFALLFVEEHRNRNRAGKNKGLRRPQHHSDGGGKGRGRTVKISTLSVPRLNVKQGRTR